MLICTEWLWGDSWMTFFNPNNTSLSNNCSFLKYSLKFPFAHLRQALAPEVVTFQSGKHLL